MEKEVLKQIKRYIDLSSKFSKSESDVFPKGSTHNHTISNLTIDNPGSWSGGGGMSIQMNMAIDGRDLYIDNNGVVKARDKQPVTRAEKIRAEAEAKAILSDEFDEYQTLRHKLTLYLTSLENLTETK
jgi:hypothetical protein